MTQAVYEGEDEYLVMQRSLDELFREERNSVQKMLGALENSDLDRKGH